MSQSAERNERWPLRRRFIRIALFTLILAGVGLMVPASPVYLPKLLKPELTVDGRTASQLKRALSDADPETRRRAAADLGNMNVHAKGALPDLLSLVKNDADDGVRAIAADAVRKIYPLNGTDPDKDQYAAIVLNDLAAALSDRDPSVRMAAASGLLNLKHRAAPAIPTLLRAAADANNDTNLDQFYHTVRNQVFVVLGEAAAGTPDAVPALTSILNAPASENQRWAAAKGLGLAGPHAKSAAPRLRVLLGDPSHWVRTAAEEALERIGVPREGEMALGERENLSLPDSEKARLWEIEHRVNVLNTYGLAPLAAALAANDGKAIASFLAPDFAGSEPTEAKTVKATGFAAVDRRMAGDQSIPLSGPQLISRLLEWRGLFKGKPSVKLVAATLNPKDESKFEGPWTGVTLLRLVGESADGGRTEVTATVAVEVTAASESTLRGSGWLRSARVRQRAIARSARPLFEDVAAARGLDTNLFDGWTAGPPGPGGPVVNAGGAYVCDFDRDGYLDLLVVDLLKVRLYRGGQGGKFTDVTEAVGLPIGGNSRTAVWADLDGDGWDDLILNTRVFRNVRGEKFEDYTERTNLGQLANLSAILPADFDRDGKIDLYLTRTSPPGNLSWLVGVGDGGQGNRLLRNAGNWQFEDVTVKTGTHGGYKSSFTAAWLDANNDGWPDLHVPNEFGDGELFINQKDGAFKPVRLADHPVDFGTMGLAVGDVNNDGYIDLFCGNMYSKAGSRLIGNLKPDTYSPDVMAKLKKFVTGSELHLNNGGLSFNQVAEEKQVAAIGWSYGPSLADLNGDGFLDIYATAGYISRDRSKPDG